MNKFSGLFCVFRTIITCCRGLGWRRGRASNSLIGLLESALDNIIIGKLETKKANEYSPGISIIQILKRCIIYADSLFSTQRKVEAHFLLNYVIKEMRNKKYLNVSYVKA